ncbi:MAG TPA: acyltransferase, partial [Pelobium sp.]|nr:acyltransferase [Pelobium sp.]
MRDPDFFVHSSSVIDEKVTIGVGTAIWHFTHISEGAVIGKNCNIGQNVFIGKNVKIGNGVKIQNNVSIYEGVTIEDDVFIGPSVVFTNILNPRAFINRKSEYKYTIVKKGATLGANSTIVCGNHIGEYSLIGAGSVLTKSTEEFELWYGNPATKKGMVD